MLSRRRCTNHNDSCGHVGRRPLDVTWTAMCRWFSTAGVKDGRRYESYDAGRSYRIGQKRRACSASSYYGCHTKKENAGEYIQPNFYLRDASLQGEGEPVGGGGGTVPLSTAQEESNRSHSSSRPGTLSNLALRLSTAKTIGQALREQRRVLDRTRREGFDILSQRRCFPSATPRGT